MALRIAGLSIRAHSREHIELSLSRLTRVAGLVALGLSLLLVSIALPRGGYWWALPAVVAAMGAALWSAQRSVVVDRRAGVVVSEQRIFGLGGQSRIPLFHLRAIVVKVVPTASGGERFVLLLDRRVGEPVMLDDSTAGDDLVNMGKKLAEVADVRFVFDAAA